MGTDAIGILLGQQCAPVLAGIKPSNLLIVERGNQNGLRHVLRGTEIQKYLLYSSGEKDYWFLFEAKKLDALIHQAETAAYLALCGYDTEDLEMLLQRLARRFTEYKENRAGFPHEMGVLFGYPLKDVQGFIENQGKNFKLSGYWKVYDDVAAAVKTFRLYEYMKKLVLELCSQGVCIPDICRVCRMTEYQW
ncbi:MAG: DUF3793 family protein [Lachnospiraceae bacterium]|nr:DUF3793 family protein [Lachnospiraceae bacterium]